MAGVAYAIAPNLMLDVSYRYVNFGDVKTASDAFGAMTLKNVYAHEVRVGIRWSFDDQPFAQTVGTPQPWRARAARRRCRGGMPVALAAPIVPGRHGVAGCAARCAVAFGRRALGRLLFGGALGSATRSTDFGNSPAVV